MRSNYLKVFALFVIVLCVYPLRTIAQIKTFLHEEKDYGLESPPRVAKIKSYDDLVVVRIVRNDTSKSNAIEHCNYDILFLRMIYPDGTVIEKDIKLEDVQLFNYCSVNIDVDEDHLKYEIIENNKILVIYYNSTDDIKVEGWGMIIDFDGKVFDRTPIGVWGYKDFRRLYKLRVPLIQISLNIKKENGFIIGYKLLESNDFEWKQYKVELDGKLTILTNGKIKLDSRAILERNSLISTVDEGYSFIYKVNDTLPNSALKDLIIAELIGYNKTEIDKVYLYRVNLLDRIPQPISCNIEYVGVGHSCSLPMIYNESNYNLKIGFLSSGAIISLNITHIEFPNNEFRFRSWRLQSLIFGGYMLPEINRANNRLDIYVFAENGTLHDILSSEINLNYAYTMLPNNTLLVARMEYNNTWGFNVIDLPKLTIDNGYYNANIESTFPGINSSISSDITNISIDFYVRVTLSDGKLSIFQIIDQRKILRQTTSGRGCILDNDDKRVIVNILDSTFNKKHLYTITSSTSGLLRLTIDGTNIIKNSSNVEQNQFFNALLDELADTVQISRGRLSKNSKNQIDPKSNDGRFLININIYESKNPYEKDVNSVIQDINYMMSYHDQSPIENGKLTYLDFTYGFIPAPNYLQEYGPKLLGLLLIIILLVIFYFLANKRERKGHNIVIFKFSLYIFDFVFDTLFIINNANDVKRLYIPSLIFYTVPIGLNMASTFLIMAKENTRNEFLSWFTENSKLASIFTILAGIDIEILNIPQFIIQILFKMRSLTYDIIPIIALISSAITLNFSIISRSHQSINYIRNKRSTRRVSILELDDIE
ncbi:unnamed protein product [Rhizophagus irregularis]|nr:unnamed protein product [Rhizophagus irregularis]